MNNDDHITPADTPSTEEDDALATDLRRKVAEIERKVADGN